MPRASTAWAATTSPTPSDAANAVRAAAGYNFRRLLEWLALLLSLILAALSDPADRKIQPGAV
jgi:hypothetical protein